MNRIRQITPTLCALSQVSQPLLSNGEPLPLVKEAIRQLQGHAVRRILIFCPDALGKHLWSAYRVAWEPIQRNASITEELHAELPSVTPVCFASMFTGGAPREHGITTYAKPVLQCDTVFDAFVRANKRVAIVAVKGSSIDTIFRNRDIDYFSEEYDPQVTSRAEDLLRANKHDVILAYVQEYDDTLHRTTPFSPEAVQAMHNNIAAFGRLAAAFDQTWSEYDRAILFCPDHGGHVDSDSGRGTHGSDKPEDLEVLHCFGLRSGRR